MSHFIEKIFAKITKKEQTKNVVNEKFFENMSNELEKSVIEYKDLHVQKIKIENESEKRRNILEKKVIQFHKS